MSSAHGLRRHPKRRIPTHQLAGVAFSATTYFARREELRSGSRTASPNPSYLLAMLTIAHGRGSTGVTAALRHFTCLVKLVKQFHHRIPNMYRGSARAAFPILRTPDPHVLPDQQYGDRLTLVRTNYRQLVAGSGVFWVLHEGRAASPIRLRTAPRHDHEYRCWGGTKAASGARIHSLTMAARGFVYYSGRSSGPTYRHAPPTSRIIKTHKSTPFQRAFTPLFPVLKFACLLLDKTSRTARLYRASSHQQPVCLRSGSP